MPRIGPPLDADDTPRRDRLVVEYNTTTNPTENGVVKDTSGRGLDGLTYDGATYDATEKALVFDGSNDFVFQNDVGLTSVFSISFWVKLKSTAVALAGIGTYASNQTCTFYITSTQFQVIGYNNDNYWAYDFPLDTWVHACVTYNGGGFTTLGNTRLYINGVEASGTKTTYLAGGATTSTTIAFPSPCNLYMGRMQGGSPNYASCSESNLKLYDVALTADEVKLLYDMGRCDEGHHVVNFNKTRVGIGLGDGEAPQAALDVRDKGILLKGYIGKPYNGESSRTSDLVIKQSGDVNDGAKASGVRMFRASNDTNSWHFGVNTGTNLEFLYNDASMAYLGRTDVSVTDFTGQHRSFLDGVSYTEYDNLEGLIVSANKNKYYDINEDITRGAHAIQISQSLPLVSLSTEEKDKACFGVISGSEDPESREYTQGSFVSVAQKQKGDRRAFINSVGEGAIWVADINGPLESGDYITTSNIVGYGQKQDGAGLMNYTVAKITMDCDFEPETQPIQRIKQSNVVETHYTGLVQVAKSVPHEFVTTVVSADDAWSNVSVSPSDVTYAEWSNLESNVQNTYTLEYTSTSNVVYDVKYTKTTTANVSESDMWDAVHVDPPTVTYPEYSNLEADVQNTYSLTFTRTTTEDKTPSEWSALDANAQALWSIQYYDTVEQKVDADYPARDFGHRD